MDVRGAIAGLGLALGIICGTVLAALGKTDGASVLFALAGSALAYGVGLYSQPYAQNDDESGADA